MEHSQEEARAKAEAAAKAKAEEQKRKQAEAAKAAARAKAGTGTTRAGTQPVKAGTTRVGTQKSGTQKAGTQTARPGTQVCRSSILRPGGGGVDYCVMVAAVCVVINQWFGTRVGTQKSGTQRAGTQIVRLGTQVCSSSAAAGASAG